MKKTALPKMLSFSAPDLREQIEALPEGTALIGISTSGRAIAVDLDAESPHVLVCTAGGGGSTTMLRSLTAQFLHQGAHALVLDPKRISHLWAKALPTVTHRGNVAGIHDALVHLASELKRRLDLDGDLDGVPRLIVAVDEANTTLRQLARYWETFRQKDDPKTSPAIAALEEALWVGRAARVHVIFDGRPEAAVLGGAVHELFATVILSRFTADTWRRLAPVAGPAPKQSRQPGRFHVVQHDGAHETQAVLMTDADVVNWLTDPDDNES
ncbi:hypothetical protein QA995_43185 [Streptomyces scabiei]|uniref:hypothetical protein n=1 Tax=Streptomyces TaxID=1883 RepID=UPI0011808F7D|nr:MULTISPECIES: hypothetical protein [Streptomyces]MDX2871517.1 hypothetical protein [Streptomyces scabiei]MDX3449258.1 hypothetical protein [Streptomyces scabiei]MDX3461257.1 hypothetical protein [Streptomyces scabiei]